MQLQCKLRKKVFYNGTPKNKQAQDKESEQNTGTRAPINPNKSLPHHMVIGTRALLALKWLVWR